MPALTEDANQADQPATEPERKPAKQRPLAIVLSSILGLFGVSLLIGGVALIAIQGFARDDDGYYTSNTELVESDGYAITTDEIDLGAEPTGIAPDDIVSSLRLRAEGADGQALFLGIARTNDVEAYLGDVSRSELTDFGPDGVELAETSGGKPSGAPADQEIWAAEAEGTGRQTLEWEPENGTWSAVLMNADGSQAVAADLDAGADIGWLIWVGIGLVVVGLPLTAGAVLLLIRVGR